jgi:hypothetical protein
MQPEVLVVATFFPPAPLKFWAGEGGQRLLGETLRALAPFCTGPALALTSQPDVLRPVLPACFELVQQDVEAEAPFCPQTAFPAMPGLDSVRAFVGARRSTVLLVDLRHAFALEHDPFGQALGLCRGEDTVVLSVNESTDHPCQFIRPEKIEALGQVRLFEDSAAAAAALGRPVQGARLTRPFPFNWSLRPGLSPAPGACYLLCPDTGALAKTELSLSGAEVLWLWEGPGLARLLFGPELLARMAAAWDLPETGALAGWSLETTRDRTLVLAERLASDTLRLRVAAAPEGARLQLVPLAEETAQAQKHLGPAEGVPLALPAPGMPGYRFVLCVPGEAGRGDALRYFEPHGKPWRYCWEEGSMVCSSTGQAIMGRQDFVPVHTLNGGLAAFGSGRLRDWPPKAAGDGWVGLPGASWLRIDSEVKALRYAARILAGEHGRNG